MHSDGKGRKQGMREALFTRMAREEFSERGGRDLNSTELPLSPSSQSQQWRHVLGLPPQPQPLLLIPPGHLSVHEKSLPPLAFQFLNLLFSSGLVLPQAHLSHSIPWSYLRPGHYHFFYENIRCLIARLGDGSLLPVQVTPILTQLSFDPMRLPILWSYCYVTVTVPHPFDIFSPLLTELTFHTQSLSSLPCMHFNSLPYIFIFTWEKPQTWLNSPLSLLCTCSWNVAEMKFKTTISGLTLNSWPLTTSRSFGVA